MELIEESSVPDIFISGIAKMERLSAGMIRVSYYTERHNHRGEIEHVLALRVIRSLESLVETKRLVNLMLTRTDVPVVASGGLPVLLDS